MFKHFIAFELFKQYTPEKTDCPNPVEMGTKSVVVTVPIIMTDEKKYSEVVDVLDQLEKYAHEMYSAAGMCSSNPIENDVTTTIANSSRPDQPASHVPPTPRRMIHCLA